MTIRRIGITMGDPGGIGPEVMVKALRACKRSARTAYVLFATEPVLQLLRRKTGLSLPHKPFRTWDQCKPGSFTLLDIASQAAKLWSRRQKGKWNFKKPADTGRISLHNACLATAALAEAARHVAGGRLHGLVTAPVNKTTMRLIDRRFIGHTEFLAQAAGVRAYAMFFASERLKVTLVTIHVPVRKVPPLIRQALVFEKIKLTYEFLKQRYGLPKPKIAVCALNPHGAETGEEEDREIVPAIRKARRLHWDVSGPYSADQLFFEAYHGRYDALISMYHDQGLAPFKMIAFRDGVNVTLGLPFIRTSPDHGTAFDIAYRGTADGASMLSALRLAQKLTVKSSTESLQHGQQT